MIRISAGQTSLELPGVVESVVRSHLNGPLIAAAAQLWIGDDELVLDMTYGRGNFWTVYRPARIITHDLGLDGVDFRQLPEIDASVDVVVFDPPYIAQGGRETSTVPDFLDRYGLVEVPKTAAGVFELIEAGMKEAVRVLRPGGRLLVKCMDYINGGKLVMGRHHVVSTALELGLVQLDEFIHLGRPGPQPPGRRQWHSRRTHTFLCVFGTDHRYRYCLTTNAGASEPAPGGGDEEPPKPFDPGPDHGKLFEVIDQTAFSPMVIIPTDSQAPEYTRPVVTVTAALGPKGGA